MSKEGQLESFKPEIITVEEFADSMKIGRTTVFEWIKKDRLKAGKHYIKIGRIIRFEWGPDLLRMLREGNVKFNHIVEEKQTAERPLKKKKYSNNRKTTINWDY